MSSIDDFQANQAGPPQIAPLSSTSDKAAHAREVVAWAQQRHKDLEERVRACHRVADSVTDSYKGGDPPSRADLEAAVVRLMSLAIDSYALSRQVIQACQAATNVNQGANPD